MSRATVVAFERCEDGATACVTVPLVQADGRKGMVVVADIRRAAALRHFPSLIANRKIVTSVDGAALCVRVCEASEDIETYGSSLNPSSAPMTHVFVLKLACSSKRVRVVGAKYVMERMDRHELAILKAIFEIVNTICIDSESTTPKQTSLFDRCIEHVEIERAKHAKHAKHHAGEL